MAYSEKQWLDAKGYYEAGLSLAQILDKTGIARSSISKKAKSEQWKHSKNVDYIEAKELIIEKKSTLDPKNQHLLNCADEVAEERIRFKNLINNNATKLADKLNALTDEISEPQDLKHLVDANDKLAITLKVADRHAQPTKIDNTNAQQNNDKVIKVEYS